jgi:hypothetical protein
MVLVFYTMPIFEIIFQYILMMAFKLLFCCVSISLMMCLSAQHPANGLQFHYDFKNVQGTNVPDATGNYAAGNLLNGASVHAVNGLGVLQLGFTNGYLDMGTSVGELIASLEDFTISTFLYIEPASSLSGNGHFVYTFSTSSACTQTNGRYIAYRVNTQRYAQSQGGWGNESSITIGNAADKGVWQHLVYSQSGNNGTIFINGNPMRSGSMAFQPKNIGEPTRFNWLGRPHFSGDSYLRGASYADFRIYNRTLSANEIESFSSTLNVLNFELDSIAVENAKAALEPDALEAVRTNLSLPQLVDGNVAVVWESSHPDRISDVGIVNRPIAGEENVVVTLTATLSRGNYLIEKVFYATVIAFLSDQEAVAFDASAISLATSKCYFLGAIELPSDGVEGSVIHWHSSNSSLITHNGEVVQLPSQDQGATSVTLTATVVKGNATANQSFDICLNADEGYAGYLFAYFTGNSASQEHIFFALSSDGYNYKTMNQGQPIISADTISMKSGVRDPHVLRGPDGKFYMVVTDMKSSEVNCNWACNWGIVLLKSDDLITWTHSKVDIRQRFPLQFGDVNRAWAPQTYYDEVKGKMMVYFSMRAPGPGNYDIIYYSYANDDFTDLETVPAVLFDNGVSTIDGDIVYHDNQYHLFFKTEGATKKGYMKAVADQLTGNYILLDKYLDQTDDAVEGACVFRLINQDKYILMYDVYIRGRYEFTESTDLVNFKVVSDPVTMDFHPRHGTVIPVTQTEMARMVDKWGGGVVVTGSKTPDYQEEKGDVKKMELYELTGRRINASSFISSGVYVLRKLYANGQVEHLKLMLTSQHDLNNYLLY